MPASIIAYDKDLPEIPGRCPWTRPSSFLVKDITADTGWREDASGRRPSRLLLIPKLRTAVDAWRDGGYPGASAVAQRLFEYWFEEEHEVAGFDAPFRYHFCQREAMETLVYLVEIVGIQDTRSLIDTYAEIFQKDLLSSSIEYQTTMDGVRQVRRYVPEVDRDAVQDLPPENLQRYALKMATGSGKTWVMAMTIVYSHFHKKREQGSVLSTNFLVVAPNVIVYQRLEKDFADNSIFKELPLVPPEWRPWTQKVLLRGDAQEPDPSGNLVLSNIQQIYEGRTQSWTPTNAVDALLGRVPNRDLSSYQKSMLERLRGLHDLVVINDEAHHVHDEDLAWSQSLLSIHRSLPAGLSLWLDFSATPKDQGGMYYPWTVVDWPLAQAVEDRIVKAPIMVTKRSDPKRPRKDPEKVTKDNVTEKYRYWIQAAVDRWKQHQKSYKKLGVRPVLFIMTEKTSYADVIGRYLWETQEFGFKESEVLVIHTDTTGEISKKDLEKARSAARDIDKPGNRIKAIVSVLMLREGWDVKNVTVVLGLRPFTAHAEILPEQVIGRGLRLMQGIGPDRVQTLEVLGTQKLLDVLRDQLESDGVGVASTDKDPPRPVIIEPVKDKIAFDIAMPITKPRLTHNIRKLSDLDPTALEPIYDQDELAEQFRIRLQMDFATTQTEVHQAEVAGGDIPMAQAILSSITNKLIQRAKLPNAFSQLYPIVRAYVRDRCFGQAVDPDEERVRAHLYRLEIQEGVANYLARQISQLTVEKRSIEFEKAEHRLSETKPFQWRRNVLPSPLRAKRTIFNYVATYNDFERAFAKFLDKAPDVLRFAALGTTEQGASGTQFRVDYLKPSGAIGFYHPDWAAVQQTDEGEVHWIIETKGRVWEDTPAKDAAIAEWCERMCSLTEQTWRYARVNQGRFQLQRPTTLAQAAEPGGEPVLGL